MLALYIVYHVYSMFILNSLRFIACISIDSHCNERAFAIRFTLEGGFYSPSL